MWHAKDPPLLNGHECRVNVKMWSLSPVMVTPTCEWKILEWDFKPQTNNQMFFRMNKFSYLFDGYEAFSKPKRA